MEISKVMLVDDDPFIRRVAQITLSSIGQWDVVVASGGAEALELISKERPDVVLLDVMMPGMDGTTTLERIREKYGAALPVIFMTAKVQQHEVENYLNSKADGVITKPFDPMTLPNEIRAIIAKRNRGLCATA
jgi:two-component system OmpR family response regulator